MEKVVIDLTADELVSKLNSIDNKIEADKPINGKLVFSEDNEISYNNDSIVVPGHLNIGSITTHILHINSIDTNNNSYINLNNITKINDTLLIDNGRNVAELKVINHVNDPYSGENAILYINNPIKVSTCFVDNIVSIGNMGIISNNIHVTGNTYITSNIYFSSSTYSAKIDGTGIKFDTNETALVFSSSSSALTSYPSESLELGSATTYIREHEIYLGSNSFIKSQLGNFEELIIGTSPSDSFLTINKKGETKLNAHFYVDIDAQNHSATFGNLVISGLPGKDSLIVTGTSTSSGILISDNDDDKSIKISSSSILISTGTMFSTGVSLYYNRIGVFNSANQNKGIYIDGNGIKFSRSPDFISFEDTELTRERLKINDVMLLNDSTNEYVSLKQILQNANLLPSN